MLEPTQSGARSSGSSRCNHARGFAEEDGFASQSLRHHVAAGPWWNPESNVEVVVSEIG